MALNFFEMSSWKLLTLSSSMWTFLHYFFPCLLGCLLAWLVGLKQKWLFCSVNSSLSPSFVSNPAAAACNRQIWLFLLSRFSVHQSYRPFSKSSPACLLACLLARLLSPLKKCDFFHSSSSKIRALFSFNVLLLLSQTKVSAVRKGKYISFFIFKLSI